MQFSEVPPNEVDFGDLSKKKSKTIDCKINCNDKFKVTMQSTKGGLKHKNKTEAPAGFAIKHPYQATFESTNKKGSIKLICYSNNMKKPDTCKDKFGKGTGVNEGATVTFKLIDKPDEPFIAGDYADKYTITVSPQS
jgi:hypothetical protein